MVRETLKHYMETHDGEFRLAGTTERLDSSALGTWLADLEIEWYVLGRDGSGRRRIHLYSVNPRFHVATHTETSIPLYGITTTLSRQKREVTFSAR